MGYNPRFLQRPRKRDNPEKQTQLAIIHYCKARGFVVGKTKTQGARVGNRFIFDIYTFRGFPDLCIFTPKFYFCEVKSATGTQSEEQKKFQELCEIASIPYLLVKNLNEFISAI